MSFLPALNQAADLTFQMYVWIIVSVGSCHRPT